MYVSNLYAVIQHSIDKGAPLKKIIAVLVIAAISLVAESRKTVVVLPLTGENIAEEGLAILTKKLNTTLTEAGEFLVVDQEAVNSYLKTENHSSLEPLERSIAVGEHFGVNYITYGTVNNDNGQSVSSIALLDVVQKSVVITATDSVNGYIRDVADNSIPQIAYQLSNKEMSQENASDVNIGSGNDTEASLYIRPYHKRSDVFLNGELLGQGTQQISRPAGTYTVYEQFRGETKNEMEITAPADKETEVRLGGKRAHFSITPTVTLFPNALSVTKVKGVEKREVDAVFQYGGEMGFTFENRYYFGINGHFHISDHWFIAGGALDWKYLFHPHKYVTLGTGLSAGLYLIGNEKYYYGYSIGKDEYEINEYHDGSDDVIVDSLTLYEDVLTENYVLPTIFATAEIGGDKIRFYSRIDLMVQFANGWTSYYLKDDSGKWYYEEDLVGVQLPEEESIFEATLSPVITAGVKILIGKKK